MTKRKPPHIRRMNKARRFMVNTCPASRHVAHMAENLTFDGRDYMIETEPARCAESMAETVRALWQARDKLMEIGYWEFGDTWQIRPKDAVFGDAVTEGKDE